MQCKALLLLAGFIAGIVSSTNAQQIDDTIARELGLVREPTTSMQSSVYEVTMNVGQQHELVFPEQGTLDIDTEDANKFEFLNVNNSLFISPLEVITKPVTATFQLAQSKQAVVLRLKTAANKVSKEPLFIKTNRRHAALSNAQQKQSPPAVPGRTRHLGSDYDQYVLLASFAARSAYAPDRLVNPPKGISQHRVNAKPEQLKRLVRERRLKATPLSSYAYRGLHLTVIELENKGNAVIHLSPELIRGAFIATSFHHKQLGTTAQDRYSAIYLISQRPFNDIIKEL